MLFSWSLLPFFLFVKQNDANLKKKTLTGWKPSVRNPDKQPYRKSGISDRHYKEKDNRFKLEKEKEWYC